MAEAFLHCADTAIARLNELEDDAQEQGDFDEETVAGEFGREYDSDETAIGNDTKIDAAVPPAIDSTLSSKSVNKQGHLKANYVVGRSPGLRLAPKRAIRSGGPLEGEKKVAALSEESLSGKKRTKECIVTEQKQDKIKQQTREGNMESVVSRLDESNKKLEKEKDELYSIGRDSLKLIREFTASVQMLETKVNEYQNKVECLEAQCKKLEQHISSNVGNGNLPGQCVPYQQRNQPFHQNLPAYQGQQQLQPQYQPHCPPRSYTGFPHHQFQGMPQQPQTSQGFGYPQLNQPLQNNFNGVPPQQQQMQSQQASYFMSTQQCFYS